MRIAVGFDPSARGARGAVVDPLVAQSHEVVDLGPGHGRPEDIALELARLVLTGEAGRAILVSSSALAASFFANKIDGVHAGVCTDTYDARRGGENGMNLMCLGTNLTPAETAEIAAAFAGAKVRLQHPITPSRAVVVAA
jgi:ribose 5-phosphate isomerase B